MCVCVCVYMISVVSQPPFDRLVAEHEDVNDDEENHNDSDEDNHHGHDDPCEIRFWKRHAQTHTWLQ